MTKAKDIFGKTLWCGERRRFDLSAFTDALQPRRTVSDKSWYNSGVFYSEKCRREIQYESGLELEFIESCLESNPKVAFYWEQPAKVPYWRGKIKANYYPDFGVYLRSGEFVIVEVKTLPEMLDHRVQAKTEGLMEFCHKRGFGLLLTDGKHTPVDLLKGKVNRKLEKEIAVAVKVEPIRKRQSVEIMKLCAASQAELHRAIIRLDLKFKPFPFKLQRGKQSPIYRQVYFERKGYDKIMDERLFDSLGKSF